MLSPAGTKILAIVVVSVVACTPSIMLVLWYRSTHFSIPQFFLYALNYVVAKIRWRARIFGSLPIAENEGAIIVCNHRGPFDPSFIALATNRVVRWMVAKEYVFHPWVAWFFRHARSIPVSRGGIDTAALRAAVRFAQQGELLGIFPEGRINDTEKVLLPGRPGAALIALKARVPVIPCYISGSPYDGTTFGFLLMSAKTEVKIGPRLDLSKYYDHADDRQTQAELTKWFLREIAVLGGVNDYVPELAGKRWKPGSENGDENVPI